MREVAEFALLTVVLVPLVVFAVGAFTAGLWPIVYGVVDLISLLVGKLGRKLWQAS